MRRGGVTLISPFVGRILDWYKKDTGRASYAPHEDPGVVSVTRIYEYFKKHGHQTEVMGASFRNAGEITERRGCTPPRGAERIARIAMDGATFRKMHDADAMAKDKLEEGIQGFSKALVALETLLGERLDAIRKAR